MGLAEENLNMIDASDDLLTTQTQQIQNAGMLDLCIDSFISIRFLFTHAWMYTDMQTRHMRTSNRCRIRCMFFLSVLEGNMSSYFWVDDSGCFVIHLKCIAQWYMLLLFLQYAHILLRWRWLMHGEQRVGWTGQINQPLNPLLYAKYSHGAIILGTFSQHVFKKPSSRD